MRDPQREGLKAAGQIAFSIAAVACGGSARTPDDGAVAVGRPVQQPPSGHVQPPRQPIDCPALIEATFPTPGDYPGTKADGGAELDRCCAELLATPQGHGPHRWDCCAQVGEFRFALCTPWGPPTPPSVTAEPSRSGRGAFALDLRAEASAIDLEIDAALQADLAARRAAIATWRARMENEHASSRVFAALAAQLEAAGLAAEAGDAETFAAEEVAHGARCGAVVVALGGVAVGETPAPDTFPLHEDAASRREAALRNVLSIACLSETVAVALIGAERAAMPTGPLRDLLGSIWADEVGHARFGWRLLDRVAPALTSDERAGLERYLDLALDHLVEHELAHLPLGPEPPAGSEALGLCSGREARQLFAATLEDVIIPALALRGLHPQRRSRGPRSPSDQPRAAARAEEPSRRVGIGRDPASSPAPAAG